jgi:predicted Rossmann fold flavoprotein
MTKRLPRNKQLIIIGGGASGLAASCIAAKHGIDTLLIEKNSKLARKLLASGNGRCNLLNAGEPIYFGDSKFAKSVLNNCSFNRLVEFFNSLGLVLKQEEGGRIYPATGRADTVLDCLLRPTKNSSVSINLNERAKSIEPLDTGFKLVTDKSEYICDNLLIAGGSIASPKLGGTEDMYNMLMPLGFNMVAPKPALCGIDCDMKPYITLDGTRLMAICTLVCDDMPTAASIGEVLFSKRGLSGVCIMQLARFLPENTENCHIYLDFSPTLGIDYCNKHKASDINMPFDMGLVAPSDIYKNTQIALDFLQSRLTILNKEDILLGALPSKLARICTKNSLNETAKAVTALKFCGLSPRGFEHAQVVSGGISTENIDPSTMQTVYSNLYISGETLNVDGDCGGYNLMFAFASGIIAAMHVAGKY